jgi:hypothetical protein
MFNIRQTAESIPARHETRLLEKGSAALSCAGIGDATGFLIKIGPAITGELNVAAILQVGRKVLRIIPGSQTQCHITEEASAQNSNEPAVVETASTAELIHIFEFSENAEGQSGFLAAIMLFGLQSFLQTLFQFFDDFFVVCTIFKQTRPNFPDDVLTLPGGFFECSCVNTFLTRKTQGLGGLKPKYQKKDPGE